RSARAASERGDRRRRTPGWDDRRALAHALHGDVVARGEPDGWERVRVGRSMPRRHGRSRVAGPGATRHLDRSDEKPAFGVRARALTPTAFMVRAATEGLGARGATRERPSWSLSGSRSRSPY